MKGAVINMGDMDFTDLGREIGDKIEQFINSKEMKDLQENIRNTVESKMEDVRQSAKEAAEYVNRNAEIQKENFAQRINREKRRGEEGRNLQGKQEQQRQQLVRYDKRQLPVAKKPKGRTAGVLLTVFGTCGAIAGWTAALFGYSMFLVGGILEAALLPSGFAAAFAGICTVAAMAGGVIRRRVRRFKNYIKTMGNKDFYSIDGLADSVSKKEKFVIRDLKKMIQKGWFKEGHLDEQETCFMLTDESYQMYLDAQRELERRKEEAERLAREQELLENDPVRKQLKIAVEEGNEYIRRIREINDDIPGEEISNKLYRLERVCTKIFEYVEDNPEKLPDIRKFMSYYLPTTLKLVQTYHEFSEQPVQGENINTAKKEIEEMLDSINQAFEKMFDKMFEDDAMDISTDISVLSMMLAQEGLLEDEFKTN